MNIHFISFSGHLNDNHSIHDALERIKIQATSLNVFDKIRGYTQKDLQADSNFWNKHYQFIKNNVKGFGFML